VALKTTCIKNVKFKIITKIKTGCQYVGYLRHSENLNWAAQNLRLGRGLDIAVSDEPSSTMLGLGTVRAEANTTGRWARSS